MDAAIQALKRTQNTNTYNSYTECLFTLRADSVPCWQTLFTLAPTNSTQVLKKTQKI